VRLNHRLDSVTENNYRRDFRTNPDPGARLPDEHLRICAAHCDKGSSEGIVRSLLWLAGNANVMTTPKSRLPAVKGSRKVEREFIPRSNPLARKITLSVSTGKAPTVQ